jgi:hypothetical protein
VRPEPAQQIKAHEHAQPVPGGGDVSERERGELVGGQYTVACDEADQVAVPVGEVTGHGQDCGLVPSRRTCACPCPARIRM